MKKKIKILFALALMITFMGGSFSESVTVNASTTWPTSAKDLNLAVEQFSYCITGTRFISPNLYVPVASGQDICAVFQNTSSVEQSFSAILYDDTSDRLVYGQTLHILPGSREVIYWRNLDMSHKYVVLFERRTAPESPITGICTLS